MSGMRRSSVRICVPLLLVALLLGWRILALGIADRLADVTPGQALSWRSDHSDALHSAASTQFDAGHLASAETLARRGIADYPLDGRNYRVLAAIADARGDRPHALRMLAIALLRSPRDLRTHMQLVEYALKARDMDGALQQLDPILRIEPEEEPELFPRMIRLAQDPATTAAFVRTLSQRPPWRARFLQTLAADERDPGTVSRMYRGLQAVGSRSLSRNEMDYWINRQINDRAWATAHALWLSSLPAAQRIAVGNMFDGGFVFPVSGSGFGWRMPPVSGVQVHTVALPKPAGNVLSLEFAGMSVDSTGVMQLLALTPGTYIFNGRAQAEALETGRGLQWTLTCAEGRQQALVSSPLLIGTRHWNGFALTFEILPTGCGAQRLQLQLGVRDRISGHASYAGLSVQRLSTSAETDSTSNPISTLPGQGDALHAEIVHDPVDSHPSLWLLFSGATRPHCQAIVCRNDADPTGIP